MHFEHIVYEKFIKKKLFIDFKKYLLMYILFFRTTYNLNQQNNLSVST